MTRFFIINIYFTLSLHFTYFKWIAWKKISAKSVFKKVKEVLLPSQINNNFILR